MKRIGLFLITNFAIIIMASITLRLLGVEPYLNANGLNLNALLAFSAVFGFMGAFVSLFLSKFMAKLSTKTQIIQNPSSPDEAWLLQTVDQLSREAGIKTPEVGIFPANQSNAFATGWNKNDALVAVSAGLMRNMRKDEIRAVLAHEIGHVTNGDMVTLALVQGVVNTFVIFFARIIGYAVDSFLRGNNQNDNGSVGIGFYITSFIAEIILGILASTVVMWFSRQREFRADAAGARLAGSSAMIGALEALRREHEVPDQMPESMTAFAITRGMKGGLAALFMSHPPLEERIQALKENRYS